MTEFTPMPIFCSYCNKLIEWIEDEDTAFDAGIDPETGENVCSTACQECAEKHKPSEEAIREILEENKAIAAKYNAIEARKFLKAERNIQDGLAIL